MRRGSRTTTTSLYSRTEGSRAPLGSGGFGGRGGFGGGSLGNIPTEYQATLGSVTVEETVPNLIDYVRRGGTLLAIGSSTSIATHAGLPMTNHLTDGAGAPLSRAEYYAAQLGARDGCRQHAPVGVRLFEPHEHHVQTTARSSVCCRSRRARVSHPVAWFDSETPLRSGWAWGEHQLFGGTTVSEAKLGEGRMFLFGPLIKKRAQPHATFKFLFNGIHLGGATPVRLGGVAQ